MKIVCDVCGTTFPETEANCPICGCAKAADVQTVEDVREDAKETTAAAAYAKGGRFAKGNVRSTSAPAAAERSRNERNDKKAPEGNNVVLIGIVIALLLAIVMVIGYIGFSLLTSDFNNDGSNQQVTTPTDDPNKVIPCEGINLGIKTHEFNSATEQLLLSVEKIPANTTDVLTFTSSNSEVATVTSTGLVQPGTKQGEAVITVSCGNFSVECSIVSTVGEPAVTEPTTPPAPILPTGFELKLNRADFTLSKEGETWNLLSGIDLKGVAASDITWTTSDPLVATVDNGKVVGVNRGMCTVTATIGDQTASCIVRCSFDAAPVSDYKISHTDVTLFLNKQPGWNTFNLTLTVKETGANVQGIVWTADKEGIVTINGNKITACDVTKYTSVNVSTVYEGETFTCIIHVDPKP